MVDRFSSVKNVGRILVGGLRELGVRIWIDPIKLAARSNYKELKTPKWKCKSSAGTLEATNVDLTLNLDKSYTTIDQLKSLPLKKNKDNIVKLSDVAEVQYGPVSEKTLFKAQEK